jgi:TetR/AcrR family transcriptional regulator, cholesterol catabolism regulator
MDSELRAAVLQLKRDRIVAAAVDIFDRQGFGHTTLDQLAEAMGVSKPFIYNHFKSKQELLAVICAQGIADSMQAIDRALASAGTPREKLAGFARDFMLAVVGRRRQLAIYTREETSLTPGDRATIQGQRREFDRKLKALLEAGVASGDFEFADTRVAALAVGGVASWAGVWYRPDGRLPPEAVANQVSALVLAMCGAARPAARRCKAA